MQDIAEVNYSVSLLYEALVDWGKKLHLKGLMDSIQIYLDHQTIPVELCVLLHQY